MTQDNVSSAELVEVKYDFDATYSPEDNKLRLYAAHRLSPELYARVKAAGYKWAPKQELFVAPMWTPEREDLAIELAGEVGDEDTSLVERQEQRAERFDDYSAKRADDAERAQAGVEQVSKRFEFGQPILVGHHSEKRARKDKERIESGLRKTIQMWETSNYWKSRAAGALAHAKYKELPAVRARRIKGLESDLRKVSKSLKTARDGLAFWSGDVVREQALAMLSIGYQSHSFPLSEFPRDPPASQYEGAMSLWSALDGNVCTLDWIVARKRRSLPRHIAHYERWVAHYENRLAYERVMLGESGYIQPPKRASRAVRPLLNYGGEISYRCRWNGEVTTEQARPITKAQLAKVPSDYKGTRDSADGTHRVRIVMGAYLGFADADWNARHGYYAVLVTDSKTHPKPGAGPIEGDEAEKVAARINRGQEQLERTSEARAKAVAHNKTLNAPMPSSPRPDYKKVDDLKQALKAGVQVVSAPQLFPTPPALAERMVALAGIEPGMRVLEPSAGTGNLVWEIARTVSLEEITLHAVEINATLAGKLQATFQDATVQAHDFLQNVVGDFEPFDRIVMNPPFADGADIKHILHARSMLKPGGLLVALCANGPRQNAKLQPLCDSWEELPPGSFASEGTGVRVVLLTLSAAD